MNIGELITFLEQFEDDVEVVLAKDGEGNSFSPLASTTAGFFIPESAFSGDFVSEENLEKDEFINVDGAMASVALWPIN